jgi:hypothetical protein
MKVSAVFSVWATPTLKVIDSSSCIIIVFKSVKSEAIPVTGRGGLWDSAVSVIEIKYF